MTKSQWTDERVALLKELHGKGHSFSMIARELGTTRNAVIAKADRLGLTHRKPKKPTVKRFT